MFVCPECGNTEFYAHQEVVMDVIVDGNKNWVAEASSAGADITDVLDTYGPYECTKCSTTYEHLR